jgi:UrcA family protein
MFTRPIFAAALVSLAAAAPALAGAPTQSVGFADLNLASTQGRQALDARLVRAAKSVCGVGATTNLNEFIASKSCFQTSVADARSAADEAIARKSGARVEVAAR